MTSSDQSPKPNWTQRWNAKSAVEKRLSLSSTKTRLQLGVVVFLFAPFVGFALIGIGQQNFLWIPGAILLAIGILAWTIGPVFAGGAAIYLIFKSLRQGGLPAAPPDRAATSVAPQDAVAQDQDLAPVLSKLAKVQQDMAAQRRSAMIRGMPWAVLVSAVLGYLVFSSAGLNLFPIAMFVGAPLIAGMFLISQPFQTGFQEAFKRDVLPTLLLRYGDFQRRTDHGASFAAAASAGVIARHSVVRFDDVFSGTHRDHTVEIADMVLITADPNKTRRRHSGKSQFRALAISLHLPRPVPATTVVADAKRSRDQFATPGHPLEQLHLEDVVFNTVYHVYSTDQVGGRALLSPAVMRRLVEASDGHDFMPPTLLASDAMLQIFLTTYNERDLFEAGSVSSSDMAAHVRAIDKDLNQVFAILDSLIDVAGTLTTPLLSSASPSRVSFK